MSRLRLIPLTLRGRLLTGLLALLIVGLLGSDFAAYGMLRSFLQQRNDRQLARAATVLDRMLDRAGPVQPTGTLVKETGSDLNILFLATDQRVVGSLPEQNAAVDTMDAATLDTLRARPNRAEGLQLGGRPFRAVYHPTVAVLGTGQGGGGVRLGAVVVALPFNTDLDTLSRMAEIEVWITTVAILVLAGLAVYVLQLGLRPLRSMAATATAIGHGDVSRRVPVDRPRSEVGQLAIALNQAFDQRHEAETRLRQFTVDASHELRTPLTTIRGWADLYFQDGLNRPGAVETAMTRIAEAAGQVSRLVEELLLLARLDEQRPLDRAEVEMTSLIAEVIADAEVVDPSRQITLHTTPGSPSTVIGDADRLQQVVRNLIGNAVQHTPAGTPIAVRLRHEVGAGGQTLRLSVRDQGPGIPLADQEHLFDRFYRTGHGRSHSGAGTGLGLGLAIVRAIVEAHHGDVRVSSRPGQGTEFEVVLPVDAEPGQADRDKPLANPQGTEGA